MTCPILDPATSQKRCRLLFSFFFSRTCRRQFYCCSLYKGL